MIHPPFFGVIFILYPDAIYPLQFERGMERIPRSLLLGLFLEYQKNGVVCNG